MRLIDADALYDTFERTPWMDNADRDIAEELVDNAPTVSPWVKTSDRLPTEADAGVDEEIVTIYDDGDTRMMGVDYWKCVALVPGRFPYWLPVPKLPEVG